MIYLNLWIFRVKDARGQSSSISLTKVFGSVRELQLYLQFFNLVYEYVVWGLKVYFLWNTVLSGFSSIRLMDRHPVMGGLYLYIGMAVVLTYVGMFQFAYQVQGKMEDLGKMMELSSASLVSLEEKKYWSRVLRSIPRMGMRVGGFNQVERESVLIFIDFSVCQILDLLLTFP